MSCFSASKSLSYDAPLPFTTIPEHASEPVRFLVLPLGEEGVSFFKGALESVSSS